VTSIVPAEGVILERILDSTDPLRHEGLSRPAYRQLETARMKTAWASAHTRRYALVDGPHVLASARQYTLAAVIDEQPVRVCGIGTVITGPGRHGRGHARTLVERLLDQAARDGAAMALMFSERDREHDAQEAFTVIPMTDIELRVLQSPRHGAPMTLVRGGEERDLAAAAAMGRIRARRCRFHLDRDVALVQHAITSKRLVAGLGTPGVRELHFFIAEEGITAAAYIVVSVVGDEWTIEECGDRDGSGARVGALLQALIARQPVERRPSIRGWLPHGFVPPQVEIVSATPSTVSMMVRFLAPGRAQPQWSGSEVLYWRSDIF
jgi:hypothetical protein